ncbi:MAG: hypothetical protein HKP53_08600 [Eudoraea sp.]|nr:hypothetical protein [Eudoraea sp.]
MNAIINEQSKFEVFLSPDEALEKLMNTIELKGWRKILDPVNPQSLKIRTRVSFRSWGESMLIEISKSGHNRSIIQINSRPLLFTTILDYGKNRSNINKIKEVFNISY